MMKSFPCFHQMSTAGFPLLLVMIFTLGGMATVTAQETKTGKSTASAAAPAGAEKLGWHLGAQAYTFNRFTFFEAVDKTTSAGMRYIEIYPGQKLSPEEPTVTVHHTMAPEARAKVQEKVRAADMKIQAYGVVNGKDEAEWRQIFTFCRDMGIDVVVAEPKPEDLDTVEKLCEEFKMKLAIHNHPEPSHYWNPDTVLAAVEGRSKLIGACADTGHWLRSGLDPLESLKKLEGRIVSLHLKDLNEKGNKKAHDVPWGTGLANVPALLAELKRQGFAGPVSIEYEHNWENSVPEVRQCADYFYDAANALAKE